MHTYTRIYAILHGMRKAGGRPHKENDNRMDQRTEKELQLPPCKKTQMTHQTKLPNGLMQIGSQCLGANLWGSAPRHYVIWNTWKSLLNCYETLYPLYCTVKGINKPYLTLPYLPYSMVWFWPNSYGRSLLWTQRLDQSRTHHGSARLQNVYTLPNIN